MTVTIASYRGQGKTLEINLDHTKDNSWSSAVCARCCCSRGQTLHWNCKSHTFSSYYMVVFFFTLRHEGFVTYGDNKILLFTIALPPPNFSFIPFDIDTSRLHSIALLCPHSIRIPDRNVLITHILMLEGKLKEKVYCFRFTSIPHFVTTAAAASSLKNDVDDVIQCYLCCSFFTKSKLLLPPLALELGS